MKNKQTMTELFWALFGIDDMTRSECPLSDSELERFAKMGFTRRKKGDWQFELDILSKLDKLDISG